MDSQALAQNYADKRGLKVADVLADWDRKKNESISNGLLIHSLFDNYFTTKIIPGQANNAQERVAINFIKDFFQTNRLAPQEAELIVYNEECDCATLIDSIVRDRSGLYYIIDWKTDRAIKDQNYGRYLLPPYSLLPDHDLMKHKLQLNFQKQLCTEYQIEGMYIGHIAETGYRLIPVDDMSLHLPTFCIDPGMVQGDLPF